MTSSRSPRGIRMVLECDHASCVMTPFIVSLPLYVAQLAIVNFFSPLYIMMCEASNV